MIHGPQRFLHLTSLLAIPFALVSGLSASRAEANRSVDPSSTVDGSISVTSGNGSIKRALATSGGFGELDDLWTDNDVRYSVGKGATAIFEDFEKHEDPVESVYLFVQYTTEPGYSGSNTIRVNGVDTGIAPADRDYGRIRYIEITGRDFGVDSTEKIENLTVTFANNDMKNGKAVLFDYVFVVVNPSNAIPEPPTWFEDFNGTGPANPMVWTYETGYKRNNEVQYYTNGDANGWMENGNFVIEARKESIGDHDYTSASILTQGKFFWQYGRAQIRAKIPAVPGMWPAIWGTGKEGSWPHGGEVDIMEYYQEDIKANYAVGAKKKWGAKWYSSTTKLSDLEAVDPEWRNQWHIWTLQWDEDNVRIYMDNKLLISTPQSSLRNADGYDPSLGTEYPFKQPFNCWLNLAMGGDAGGSVSGVTFPQRYYIDYWKIWEGATDNVAPSDITLDSLDIPENLPIGAAIGHLTATDPDPAEVHHFQLVSGEGDTHNDQFVIPDFISDNTRRGVLKTAQTIDRADGATRSVRVRVTDLEGATFEKVLVLNVISGS